MSQKKRSLPFDVLWRFMRNVHLDEHPDTCWTWLAATDYDGYGKFNIGRGTMVYAHRLSYQAFNGPLRPGRVIDHLCNNRRCVRPDHLDQVTQAVNLRRAVERRKARAASLRPLAVTRPPSPTRAGSRYPTTCGYADD